MNFLNWEHETVTLPIGEGHYTFRTLSFYDVSYLAPHIIGVERAISDERNIKMAEHVNAIITHLCPELVKGKDYAKLSPDHVDTLIAFYKAQDWSRIKAMLALEGSEPSEEGHEENMENFRRMCFVAVGKNIMEAPKFADKRFEFVADVFIEMHARWKELDTQQHPNRMTVENFGAMISAVMPHKTN